MSIAEYKSKLLGYKRTTPKVRVTVDPTNTTNTTVPAAVDWTTKGAVNAVKD